MKIPKPEILLERGAVILLNKPGGLLTQGPPGVDSLELRLKQFLIERENKPGKAYVGVPHRLDRPVSGVIVMVKNVRAAKRISEQIRERTVNKKYWAIVAGDVRAECGASGRWTDWMRKIPDMAKSEIVNESHEHAREAVLDFRVLNVAKRSFGVVSHLEIDLITGRTHQIRLQCASRGFQILGDELYGSTLEFGPETLDLRKRWIALHARHLGFTHPIDKEPIEFDCPLPSHWNSHEAALALGLDGLDG